MVNTINKKKTCYFCENNIKEIDYKNIDDLKLFTNSYGQILSKKRTGVCTKHQNKLANAVKRARIMALMIFTNR